MTRVQVYQPIAHADTQEGRVPTALTQLVITNDTASKVPLQVYGATAQSDDLTRWWNATGSILAYIDKDGAASFPSLTLTTGITLPDHSLALSKLVQVAANTVLANATAGSADVTALAIGTNTVLGRVAGNIVAAQLVAAQVTDATLTYAKLQNVGATSLLGNPTGSGAAPSEVTLNATLSFTGTMLQRAALTGDVTAPAGSNATTLAKGNAGNLDSGTLLAARLPAFTGDVVTTIGTVATTITTGAVTYAKIQSAGSACILAATSGGAAFGEVTLDASLEFSGSTIRRAAFAGGDVTGSAGSAVLTVGTNKVTVTMLAQLAGLSVLGRSTNSTGNVAAITAVTDGHVLRLSGTAVGFGVLAAGAFATAPGIVTLAMLDNGTALSVAGRSANSSGARADIAATAATGAVLRESGSTLGFGTLAAGAFATGPGIVTPAMLNNGTAFSVLGVTGSSAAARADITTTTGSAAVLRESGGALGFGTIATAGITAAAVTYAKIQDVTATDLILGRKTAGAGTVEEIACTSVARTLIAQTTQALMRTTGLGLDTMATQAASAVNITGGTIAGTTMSSTTNDLGGASGAKGRNATPIIGRRDDSGSSGITAEGADIGDVYDQTCMMTMPVACKMVKASVNVQHGNGSAPGSWRLVVLNDTAGTNATMTVTMANVSYANNVTTGTLSSELAFAAGDRLWFYIDANGSSSLSGCILSIQLTPVTT